MPLTSSFCSLRSPPTTHKQNELVAHTSLARYRHEDEALKGYTAFFCGFNIVREEGKGRERDGHPLNLPLPNDRIAYLRFAQTHGSLADSIMRAVGVINIRGVQNEGASFGASTSSIAFTLIEKG